MVRRMLHRVIALDVGELLEHFLLFDCEHAAESAGLVLYQVGLSLDLESVTGRHLECLLFQLRYVRWLHQALLAVEQGPVDLFEERMLLHLID